MKAKLCYLFLMLSTFTPCIASQTVTPSVGKTHFIFLQSSPNSEDNFYRYYNEAAYASTVLKSLNQKLNIYSGNGNWELTPQWEDSLFEFNTKNGSSKIEKTTIEYTTDNLVPLEGKLKTINDLKKILNDLHIKDQDNVFIFINGHGHKPENDNAPESSGPSLPTVGKITDLKLNQWKNMATILERYPKVNFQIVSTICYGGGVHYLSRKLNNIATIASTSHFNEDSSGFMDFKIFSKKFWKMILVKKGKISFGQVGLYSLKNDPSNGSLGKISSLDFLDYVLKKGAYSRTFSTEKECKYSTIKYKDQYIGTFSSPVDYQSQTQVEQYRSNFSFFSHLENFDDYNDVLNTIERLFPKGKNNLEFAKLIELYNVESDYNRKVIEFLEKASRENILKFYHLLKLENRSIIP